MFAYITPIRNKRTEDTGKRIPAELVVTPTCLPSRSSLLLEEEGEKRRQVQELLQPGEYAYKNKIMRDVPGPVLGLHISAIHMDRKCGCLSQALQNPEVIELSGEDLDKPMYALLPVCQKCLKRMEIAARADTSAEEELAHATTPSPKNRRIP